MSTFKVAVTGDTGVDIFTRTTPSVVSESEKDFYPSVAYDLEVPCGAKLHCHALQSLLPKPKFADPHKCIAKQPTLPKTLQFLHDCKWNGETVYRIKQMLPRKLPAMQTNDAICIDAPPADTQCLLIYDSTRHWRSSTCALQVIDSFLKRRPNDDPDRKPRIIVNLSGPVPQLKISPDGLPTASKEDKVWEALLRRPKDVVVICSITALRHAGAAVSRRLSWEQTVEDAIADLQLFEPLQALSHFRHLIIRFGFAGSLYIEATDNEDEPHKAHFIFAPNVRDGVFRDPNDDGRIVGRKAVTAACLIREIERHESDQDLPKNSIINAIKSGMLLGMQMFDHGFPCPSAKSFQVLENPGDESTKVRAYLSDYFLPEPIDEKEIPPQEIVTEGYDALLHAGSIRRDRILGAVEVPSHLFGSSKEARRIPWQILRHQVQDGRISRINLGIAICKYGHDEVLNRNLPGESPTRPGGKIPAPEICELLRKRECLLSANEPHDEDPLAANVRPALPYPTSFRQRQQPKDKPVYIPVLQFGKFIAIEREEIESFRSIRNLMKTYVESPAQPPGARRMSDRPISVAVFGSPGSGKSFAIKQIAKSINESASDAVERLEQIECNVAQFRSVDDLGDVITRIASSNNEGKIPLVFFDEFDCEFQGKPLGWLKYFLGPMQDGTFYGAKQTISFGRAIFIFAGGIYRTITDFDAFAEPVGSPQPEKTEPILKNQALFRDQKGPDFVSRLRGHINVLTVNPDSGAPKDEYGYPIKPIIRRALILRSYFESEGKFVVRQGCKVASIDDDILYALLTVDEYRHQVRSMEAILQMCTPLDGVIEKASLPSRAQLNMHVDADEFFIRVQRGRFRKCLASATSLPLASIKWTEPSASVGRKAKGLQDVDAAVADGRRPSVPEIKTRKPSKRPGKIKKKPRI